MKYENQDCFISSKHFKINLHKKIICEIITFDRTLTLTMMTTTMSTLKSLSRRLTNTTTNTLVILLPQHSCSLLEKSERKSITRTKVRAVCFFCFFCGSLVLVSWQAFISSLVLKLDFISQPSSKSTLPFAGLQHMQQCQVNFNVQLLL